MKTVKEIKVRLSTLEKVLDCIQQSSGVTAMEIKESTNLAFPTVKNACQKLLELNCISMGAVQYIRKGSDNYLKQHGETGLTEGYFYESDLPEPDGFAGFCRELRQQHK